MGKRHHYVPRFYLNAFASARRRIHVFNLRRELSVANASLRDQCYGRRLYGKDDELERALSIFEEAASRVFVGILAKARLPKHGSSEHRLLLTFLSIQLVRTVAAHVQAQRMSAALGNALFDGSPPPDWGLSSDQAMSMMLAAAPGMRDTIGDLAMALVRAEDSSGFVTSDNPLFRYNFYCEGIKDFGVTGTKLRGFQLFLPLSPHLILHLYDAAVYKVSGRKQAGAIVATAEDVTVLNRLQFVSASENIYFNDWRLNSGLRSVLQKVKLIRQRSRPRITIAVNDNDDHDELIHQYWPMPQLGLNLSFLKIPRNARRVPLLERIRLVRPRYVATRDERLGESRRYTVRRRV